jgi:integrase
MHLWTVLDGKHRPNPVRSVPKFRPPAAPPRAISYATIRTILDALRPSATKARLLVLAHTGLPHAQIMQLTPADVDLAARTVTVHGRRKGAGTGSSIRPLSREAVAAFALFAQMNAWGPFSTSSLRTRFRAACVAAKVPPLTPYVLRHSYGTQLLRLTGDLHATQALMGHSDPRQTQRYASGASDARLTAAIQAMDDAAAPPIA